MSARRLGVYSVLSLLMISLGGSFHSLLNQQGNTTALPPELCLMSSLLHSNSTWHPSFLLTPRQTQLMAWVLLCVFLPCLTFVLDAWSARHQSWTFLKTATFWKHFVAIHQEWILIHVVGQSIAFGTSELLRYFFISPNSAFWETCLHPLKEEQPLLPQEAPFTLATASAMVLASTSATSPNTTTTPMTTTTTAMVNALVDTLAEAMVDTSTISTTTPTTVPSPFHLPDACQPNATGPLLLPFLCTSLTQFMPTTPPSAATAATASPDQLLTFLIQNLHSSPNIMLSLFGNASFMFAYLFYKHPLRAHSPSILLGAVWLTYSLLFAACCIYFHQLGQATFLGLLYSFVYGIMLQASLFIFFKWHSPPPPLPPPLSPSPLPAEMMPIVRSTPSTSVPSL